MLQLHLLELLERLFDRLFDLLQRRVREALAREEDEADADPDRRLDRLQADPEGDAVPVVDAVGDERRRDRDLEGADVAGPER